MESQAQSSTTMSRKDRLIQRARDFKQKINIRAELRYEMYLSVKFASPYFEQGCNLQDVKAGNQKFEDAYKNYIHHDEGRTATRQERVKVREILVKYLSPDDQEKYLHISPLSKEFDSSYYLFIGLMHSMSFELTCLDFDSTTALTQVFQDEMRNNPTEAVIITEDQYADVIVKMDHREPLPTEPANSRVFKRIHLQSGAKEVDSDFLVLRRIVQTTQFEPKKGTGKIEASISFLKALKSLGKDFIVHNNNESTKTRLDVQVTSKTNEVISLVYPYLPCAEKFKVKYVMGRELTRVHNDQGFKDRPCQDVDFTHLYTSTRNNSVLTPQYKYIHFQK